MARHILILGGGAAGIAAAVAAAETAPAGTRVTLLERNARVGKKLLATGNGRCNLSNAHRDAGWYFSADRKALAACLAAVEQADPLGWFAAHGLWCREPDEAGRIYPYSNQAADVLNLLLDWLERTGVEVRTDCAVQELRQQREGYTVRLAGGESLRADAVICALGGSAGPQFGTDGFGPELARQCGLRTEPLYPCLVPLQCEKKQVQGLAGIRVKGDATLLADGRPLRTERGEVQFTEYGLSGIAVMQLSGLLRPGGKPVERQISLNLFPGEETDALAARLAARAKALPGVTAAGYTTGLVNRRVGLAVWKACGLGADTRPAAELRGEDWLRLARGLTDWRFTGLQPVGWNQAQTTGGGIALSEVEPESFGLRGCPGLYFVGETLDCAGSCGGYNLHWAFGTGLLAGRHAAQGQPPQRAKPRTGRKK
ncbi:MAG: aminoacetone oxidase family FAD-binding enzyme [Oscillospiraceae bacterium]|nr:aminoacetone oxidase family FAD-binding enzyme [Oscillospiraceae bacterium]